MVRDEEYDVRDQSRGYRSVGGEFAFSGQKTMYGGNHIAKGDTIFVFASENLMTDLENLEMELIDPRN
jgi:hypothetical protein